MKFTTINKLDQCLLEGMQAGQMLIGLSFSLVAQSWSNMSKFWGDIIWYDISVNLPWWLCWIGIDRDSYFLHSSTLDLLDANDLASHAAIVEIPGNFFLVIGHKSYLFYIPRTLQGTQRCVLRRERMMFSSHEYGGVFSPFIWVININEGIFLMLKIGSMTTWIFGWKEIRWCQLC